ncbi:Chemotaxis protein CheA [Fundidesulfovibrio magnetotacticus]|uniref:histidine kinase n=1 Tax=Fundidesulfovibrio magnetotacticus TaxID=2730080 RepID=A0A6V8LRC1_9BACT|nr:hybrid sensor histidine kinase/response regulator [Fundidesulfovibrio magnetotacticus]GFK93101.1 Chemotaxis protein CheA [Fundidesulfovibrio magnetotacticus]
MTPDLADLSLLDLFAMELATHRQAIEDGLVGIESGASPERLEGLMRAAHSIKGAARIVELTQAVGLAHAMEDLFQAAQQGRLDLTSARVDALLAANDFFGELSRAAPADLPDLLSRGGERAAAIEHALRQLLSEDSAPRASEAAPKLQAPAAPSPPQASVSSAAAPPREDGVLRLSSELVGRLMGLAGQCVVESGALARVFAQVRDARRAHFDLEDLLAALAAQLGQSEAGDTARRARELFQGIMAARAQADKALDDLSRRLENLSGRLYDQVLGSRMRPFAEGVRGLPRMVRDVCRELGREARFTVEGGKTPVDRDILERLDAPLGHLLRNALDHGLEPPEERVASGKPAQGHVVLSARHAAGNLEVRLCDDGRGMDPEALRARVTALGLAAPDMAERLTREELFEFLFLPGFTTSSAVTSVSGRGVGLDAVRVMLQECGGRARVESEPGNGATFTLTLPVSRSVVRALVFTAGGEPYALALSRIARVLLAEPGDIQSAEGRQFVTVDGRHVGLVPAARLLRLAPGAVESEATPVVVLQAGNALFGLAAEALLGERDLVVHPLDPRLGRVPNVAAASLLDDGRPVLILDDAGLARSLEILLAEGRLPRLGRPDRSVQRRGPKRVLVVDDSLTVREVERQILAGRGYRAVTAVDGMEGLALARSGEFDLVVTDVDMPRMTGIELTRALKADPLLARTPVMIVSYKDRPEDRLAGLEAGADHYLPKSGFQGDALLDAVLALIGEPE